MCVSVERQFHLRRDDMNKKDLLVSAATIAAGVGCVAVSESQTGPENATRCESMRSVSEWYKGQTHSHTLWSDGTVFPDQAVERYKAKGYHFFAMTDHNVFAADVDHWIPVEGKEYPVLNPMHINYQHKFANTNIVADYRKRFKYEERFNRDGSVKEIRAKTFRECARLYNEPGKFLLIPGCEASHAVAYSEGPANQVHCCYLGIEDLLDVHRQQNWGWTGYDIPLGQYIESLRRDAENKAKEWSVPYQFTLCHPIWSWYDVSPEALIDAPDVRFFEVCNNGGGKAPPEMPQNGWDTDRFWDVVNAFRARRGQRLLLGTGSDDVHSYFDFGPGGCAAFDAWIRVNAAELTWPAIQKAMDAGDFVACEGLEPETVDFDSRTGTLNVSVAGEPGRTRTIRFIVSKKDFSEKPVKDFEIFKGNSALDDKGKKVSSTRRIRVYDEKIGMVVKTVTGNPGESVSASYTLADDDLYVRARFESDGDTVCHSALHPKCPAAWTQPYCRK